MKVSYQRFWNTDGTCYKQTITTTMDEDTLTHLNKKLADIKSQLRYGDMLGGHCVVPENIKWLDYGRNFLTITEFVVLKRIFEWEENKRVLDGRNTIFRIKFEEL